ncbi:MAG: potassium transporter [Xanthomonadales bacterium]|nr:Trk system potassium uptake protein TrkH [Xanthomonadales bacterium]MCC6591701.1 potassium transporter [Xanthomonadales bacterium]MCE7931266.1 potassium transporter [Xanthomonadales bacterium PRO6]
MSAVAADVRNSAARLATALRAVGNVQLIVAMALLPSIGFALWDGDGSAEYFVETFLLMLSLGGLLIVVTRGQRAELRLRDGFLVTSAVWLIAASLTPLPLMFGPPHLSYVDAVFEVVSGLTTTGATAIVGIDELPRSVKFYRQSLHFLGGMGIVVLAVAILPTLRVGGAQLTKGETSGPNKDSKLTPRIQQTAAALWLIYCGLNALCALAYWLGGMDWFDAITHAFATIATGGFGNYDASFAAFDSLLLESIAVVFMMLGATNFALHFLAWGRGSIAVYGQDPEFRAFLAIIASCCLLAALGAWSSEVFPSFLESLRHASFHVVSMYTSTGFTTTGFANWPGFAPAFIMLITFLGGCAGSTCGGLKAIRVLITAKLAWRELMRVIHPRGQFVIKIGDQVVGEGIVVAIAGFITVYIAGYIVLSLAVTATGVDAVTAFSIIASCMNNVGPALGEAATTVQPLNDGAVWLCSFAMLLGRLEVFTLLVLLTPAFWRD